MERLSGLDAGFLYMETPAHPMHTLKLLVLEPEAPDVPGVHDTLHAGLSERLHLLPPLRRRLLEVPFGLHHPLWLEDPSFELGAHLRRTRIPAPGTQAQMDAVVADIAAVPLERTRPLWEMWALEGLEGGRTGLLVKIHHAVADGLAFAHLLANVMRADASGGAAEAPPGAWQPDRIPSFADLVREAARDQIGQALRFPALALRTQRRFAALLERRRAARVRTPMPVLDIPVTSFNGALTSRRSFATASFSLSRARSVKEAFGVTLNDVVLGIVSGALRAYLGARGELPARPLVASVPTSAEHHGEAPHLSGNRVSSLFTSLATDVADPVERLMTIHAVASEAKTVQRVLGAELLGEWAAYAPPPIFSWVLAEWARRGLANVVPPAINLIVSNVPGPRTPLAVPGHRVSAIYSVGPVLEGIGLNITAWSYLDDLHVAILGCRDMVPEPGRIASGMRDALDELVARAPTARPAPAPGAARSAD